MKNFAILALCAGGLMLAACETEYHQAYYSPGSRYYGYSGTPGYRYGYYGTGYGTGYRYGYRPSGYGYRYGYYRPWRAGYYGGYRHGYYGSRYRRIEAIGSLGY